MTSNNILAFKHLFEVASSVSKQTKKLFDQYGFCHVHIRRTFADGTMICLSNNPKKILDFIYFSDFSFFKAHYNPQEVESPSGMYLWNDGIPPVYIDYMVECCSLFDGVAYYANQPNYCDVVGLAFPCHFDYAISFFFTIQEVIKEFCSNIIEMNENALNIAPYRRFNYEKVVTNSKQYNEEKILKHCKAKDPVIFEVGNKSVELNKIELNIFRFYYEALTIQEMAKKLELSIFKVKNILQQLRMKLNDYNIPQ